MLTKSELALDTSELDTQPASKIEHAVRIDVPWEYTEGAAVLVYHRQQLAGLKDTNPYYKYTDKNEAELFSVALGDGCVMRVAPVGHFTAEEMAVIICQQTVQYVEKGTMGKSFPQNDIDAWHRLNRVMASGFTEDRIVVVVEKEGVPVGGIQGYWGASENTLKGIITEGQSTTLSTLEALLIEVSNEDDDQVKAFLEEFGDVAENQVLLISRLFTLSGQELQELGIDIKILPLLVVAALGKGSKLYADLHNKQPSLAMYDMHSKGVQSQVERYFKARLMAENGQLKPNPIFNDDEFLSILNYHYRQDDGGYGSKLFLGYFLMEEFFPHSSLYLFQNEASATKKKEKKLRQPEDTQPKIVGMTSNELWNMPVAEIEVTSFSSSCDELLECRKKLENHPFMGEILKTGDHVTKGELDTYLVQSIQNLTKLSFKKIQEMVGRGRFTQDLVDFYQQVIELTGGFAAKTEVAQRAFMEEQAQVIITRDADSGEKRYVQQVHPEALYLLQRSRMLGLVPKEVTDYLKNMKIRVVGASGSARTVALLASMLSASIEMWDDGKMDAAKANLMPGGMSSHEHYGQYKAVTLQEALHSFNPYGNFQAHIGRAVEDESKLRPGFDDVTYDQLFEGADAVIEVIDHAKGKAKIRLTFQNDPEAPLIFWLADTGEQPIAGIERAADRNPFNANLTREQLKQMLEIPDELSFKMFVLSLNAVYDMLKQHMSTGNVVGFMYYLLGIMQWWSQPPTAAVDSASSLVKQMLHYAQQKVKGKTDAEVDRGQNLTVAQAPTNVDGFSLEDKHFAHQVLQEMLEKLTIVS